MSIKSVLDRLTVDKSPLDWHRMERDKWTVCGAQLERGTLETRCLTHQEPVALLCEVDAEGQWGIWIGLPGENPVTSPYGFCVATGSTKDEALARAVLSLQRACEVLGRGDVEEYTRPVRTAWVR